MTVHMNADDRTFLSKALNEAIDSGYIKAPSNWRGHHVSKVAITPDCGSCFLCCSFGGGSDNKGGIVVAVILFVFAFFVGLYYTANSIRESNLIREDLKKAEQKAGQFQPPISRMPSQYPAFQAQAPVYPGNMGPPNPQLHPYYHHQHHYQSTYPSYTSPQPVPQQPDYYQTQYQMPHSGTFDYSQQIFDVVPEADEPSLKSLYADAKVLLEGRRIERIYAAASQGAMTLGSGMITIAFMIALFVEPGTLTIGFGASGGFIALGGIIGYSAKYCWLMTTKEQEAANRLAQGLAIPS